MIVLTEKSTEVLAGNAKVELVKVVETEEKKTKLVAETSLPYIQALFDELRTIRMSFSVAEKVPPYVIFSDATLVEMATYLPHTESEMRKISGVGDLKFQKYGDAFLETIRAYCLRNSLVSRMDLRKVSAFRKPRTKRDLLGKDTYHITLDMYRDGQSIDDIARERGLQPSTVGSHLARFVASGEVRLDEVVPLNKIDAIREAVLMFKDQEKLGPVKEYLGDEYSYGEIKAVLAVMQGSN